MVSIFFVVQNPFFGVTALSGGISPGLADFSFIISMTPYSSKACAVNCAVLPLNKP